MVSEVGVEPTRDGFKARCLTTWLLRMVARLGIEPRGRTNPNCFTGSFLSLRGYRAKWRSYEDLNPVLLVTNQVLYRMSYRTKQKPRLWRGLEESNSWLLVWKQSCYRYTKPP